MNFFEHQQRARQRTTLAVLLFILATLAVVAATNLVVLGFVAFLSTDPYLPPAGYASWIAAHPRIMLWTSLVTIGLVAGASLYRMATLASGGGAVAQSLGGTLIDAGTRDPLRRQLINVVEETAIAAGVPVPQVYVLESEGGINAFAAGYSSSDAVIAVTRGTLETLTRDELQGVIAHEFSHILNGDMRLNMRLIGVSFGILVIALTGRMILRGLSHSRSSSDRGGQALLLGMAAGLTLVAIGYIGVLFTRLIKAAVSRHREFLADASAVQFTRNPRGIAGALKKIAVSPLRATLTSTESEEIGHMLIAERHGLFDALFASHPPILDRIRTLEPSFDPAELEQIRLAPMVSGTPPPPAPTPLTPAAQLALLPLAVIATIGNPGAAQLTAAAQRRGDIPLALQEAAHSPQDALAVVLAVVLSQEALTRERQIKHLRTRIKLAPDALARLEALAGHGARLAPALRLPLLEIAFPALRQRPPEQLRALAVLVDELLRMDGQVSVLDYALGRLLRVQLTEALTPRAGRPAQPILKLHALRSEAQTLFAVMAQAGHDDERSARAAFDAGMRRLLPMAPPDINDKTNGAKRGRASLFAPTSDWITTLDHSLTRLDSLPPAIKQALIEALVLTVAHDRQVTLGEAELLRVVCASLHCPLPPLVADAAA
ncbi:MAG TPA: M48 family metallopeptidase [Acidiferrobacterales bacterium]|nr:M48 family metallopeptidase [Acidiferrobacterales bacterium]